MFEDDIPATFIQYAADILGDTNAGLSGPNIVKATAAYAVEYDVRLPHPTYPFEAGNKRTALYENLMAFSPSQQYRIIKELCDHPSFSLVPNAKRRELKLRLVTRYQKFAPEGDGSEINETLIKETRHWLDGYPRAEPSGEARAKIWRTRHPRPESFVKGIAGDQVLEAAEPLGIR